MISCLALFIALTGTALAATVGRNDIRSKHIKNQQVRSADVKNDNLKGKDIKDDSLTGDDVDESTLSVGGGSPTGTAGGDLTGAYPNPLIATGVVTSAKLANGAVGPAQLATNAVNSGKVTDDSLTNADLGPGSVHASELGNAGFTLGPAVPVANGAVVAANLDCPAGRRMLSGGALTNGNGMIMQESHPNTSSQWRVEYWNISGAARTFNIVLHCLHA